MGSCYEFFCKKRLAYSIYITIIKSYKVALGDYSKDIEDFLVTLEKKGLSDDEILMSEESDEKILQIILKYHDRVLDNVLFSLMNNHNKYYQNILDNIINMKNSNVSLIRSMSEEPTLLAGHIYMIIIQTIFGSITNKQIDLARMINLMQEQDMKQTLQQISSKYDEKY